VREGKKSPTLWPARNYPRFRIWRPSSGRQRDFNPPEQRAAQHTLCRCPTPPRRACGSYGLSLFPPVPTGRDVPEVSRFSCLKFLGVPGVYDYAGPAGMLAFTLPVHAAFRLAKDVGALIARFRSSIPRPPIPLFMLHCAPHDAQRKTRGRVDRYSFLVRLFHPLLQTGLSRRTGYPLAG
jgi:hypothetical protein